MLPSMSHRPPPIPRSRRPVSPGNAELSNRLKTSAGDNDDTSFQSRRRLTVKKHTEDRHPDASRTEMVKNTTLPYDIPESTSFKMSASSASSVKKPAKSRKPFARTDLTNFNSPHNVAFYDDAGDIFMLREGGETKKNWSGREGGEDVMNEVGIGGGAGDERVTNSETSARVSFIFLFWKICEYRSVQQCRVCCTGISLRSRNGTFGIVGSDVRRVT